ncbi:hypothetical protein SAMN04489727_2138 [Amycolatopsis tolypomycina]|uniref:Uncharacterized protein n=1 Tax=Amycolatopsis tolypomycina TaxID=208445 RepID=A0A1H4JRK3_9PSEU|nr:hypothetical protein [Amycolatopsis tolypomycina]SEB48893.1 hypothetical protein SAMN04489727_2138 [Amycolatopsis tolypomycina]
MARNKNNNTNAPQTCTVCSSPATTVYAGDPMCAPHAASRQELDERPCFRLYGPGPHTR